MLTCLMTALLAVPTGGDFRADMARAGGAYNGVKEQTEKALEQGDLAAAQKLFLDAVAEDKRTAAHWFILGNLWFDLDPAFAMRMHEKAYALAPEEPAVRREWALELHRAARFAEAEPLYVKLVSGDADEDATYAALRADCLLALGKPAEAAEAWKQTQGMADRGHVEHIFRWVYGPSDHMVLRSRWLGELRAKDLTHAEDLLLGDLLWEVDEEQYGVNYNFMQHDQQQLEPLLDPKGARALDLFAVANVLFIDWEQDFPEGADSVPRKTALENAKERHWIGEQARLPAHPRLARTMLELLLRHEVDPAALLAAHATELQRRAELEPADAQAAEALVLLARKARSPKLAEYEKLVPATSVELRRQEIELARKKNKPLTEPLARSIQAQLQGAHPDAAALDRDFELLAQEAARKR